MAKRGKRTNWKAMAALVGAEIQKSQKIDYPKLCKIAGGIGATKLARVLKYVDDAGITGYVGQRRKIIVDAKGKKKPDIVVNDAPRKRRRRKRVDIASVSTMASAVVAAAPASKPNGFTLGKKQAVLGDLIKAFKGSETADVLSSINADLPKIADAEMISQALQKAKNL